MDILSERKEIENEELTTSIQESAKQKIGEGNKIWVAIHKAQKCPSLFNQIKVLYDKYKDKNAIKFILTGSDFLSLHQLSAESLAGRIELYHLREFGLRETVLLQKNTELPNGSMFDIACDNDDFSSLENHINKLEPFKKTIEESIGEQIIWGGLPEVLQTSEFKGRSNYLANYLQTYLEKDIRAIATITDINLYQKLIEIIAEQTGSVRQDKNITEALGCSRDTLKKYRRFLLATLVYKEVYPFIGSSLKRLIKTPKGYLADNGLISYLTGIYDIEILQKSGLIGHRFENWFLKELQIWLDRHSKLSQIYYWRTSSGVEVDFVVEKNLIFSHLKLHIQNKFKERKLKT